MSKQFRDDYIVFKKRKSNASCRIDDIVGFIVGPFSSRFWMMRKHINSMDNTKQDQIKLPFYAWQCLSLQLKHRTIDLVIEDDTMYNRLVEFLIISLRTVDGVRDSALPHLNYMIQK